MTDNTDPRVGGAPVASLGPAPYDVVTASVLLVFDPDVAAWHDWTVDLDPRQFWNAVPPDLLPRVVDEVAAPAGNRGEAGPLHLTQQARHTIGRAA